MRHCQTIIAAETIITQNAERTIINDGAIAIADGKIAAAGKLRDIRGQWLAEEIIDPGHLLLMPGLVNAHTHAAMTFLRGFADDLPLMQWLRGAVFPVEARLTAEIVELGSLLGFAEMLATGTTACVDMYIFEHAVLAAAAKAGLRCLAGEVVFDFPSACCQGPERALAVTEELALQYAGHERLAVSVCPHAVYTASPENLRQCGDLARRLGLPVHMHLAETKTETAECMVRHGRRPVALAAACGLMDAHLLAAHLVDINDEDMAQLRGACGIHNPSSNMKLASGAAPVIALQKAGAHMALGSDGAASNNQLNMFAEMRQAALLRKLADGNPASLPAQAALDMATLGGAAAFGNARFGRIEPGAPADIIGLDLRAPNMQPLYNPVSQVVYAASGHECRLTMVAGEILYQDGKFSRFDYSALLREAAVLRAFVLDNQ